jgi:hypothetical protein
MLQAEIAPVSPRKPCIYTYNLSYGPDLESSFVLFDQETPHDKFWSRRVNVDIICHHAPHKPLLNKEADDRQQEVESFARAVEVRTLILLLSPDMAVRTNRTARDVPFSFYSTTLKLQL